MPAMTKTLLSFGHGYSARALSRLRAIPEITAIEPVGNYAILLHFDDGHNTGIYSWDTLYRLGSNKERNWQDYLQRLKEAGAPHSELGNAKS